MNIKHKLKRNISLILTSSGIRTFIVVNGIIVPIYQSHGLTLLDVFICHSVLSFVTAVFEVPSGYICDLFGRKKVLIISHLFWIGATFFLFRANSIFEFVIFNILAGLSTCLLSGTDLSILYDSQYILEGKKVSLVSLVGKRAFYMRMNEAMGSLLGGILVIKGFDFPRLINFLVSFIPLIMVIFVFEPPRVKMNSFRHWDNFKYIYKSVFKKSSYLTLLFANFIFFGCATLVATWSIQAYWTQLKIPLIYFGAIWAVCNLTIAFIAKQAHWFNQLLNISGVVLLVAILPVIGLVGMGLVEYKWGAFFVVSFLVARGLHPVILDAINIEVGSEMRATVNSLTSLGVRFLFCILGPFAGLLMKLYGIFFSLKVLGVFYFILFLVLTLPLIKKIRSTLGVENG